MGTQTVEIQKNITNDPSYQPSPSAPKQNMLFIQIVISLVAAVFLVIHYFHTIDNIGLSLIVLAILPWLLPLLGNYLESAKLFGNEFNFLKKNVDEQKVSIKNQSDDIELIQNITFAGIVSKHELKHLQGLFSSIDYPVTYNHDLKNELNRLDDFGFIFPNAGKGLNTLDEKFGGDINKYHKHEKTEFNLKDYVHITEYGEKYMQLAQKPGLPERP